MLDRQSNNVFLRIPMDIEKIGTPSKWMAGKRETDGSIMGDDADNESVPVAPTEYYMSLRSFLFFFFL